MTRVSHLTALAACLLALAGVPHALAAAAPEPVAVDASFKPSEQAAALLKQLGDDKHYRGIRRVAVTQFAVQFVTADSISGETAGGFGSNSASVTGHYKLSGVGQAEFQAAADAFHAEFERQLQAAGLEVVPKAQVLASPIWQRLAATGQTLPTVTEETTTVAPQGLALFGVSRAVLEPAQNARSGSGVGGLGNLLGAVSAIGNIAQAVSQGGDNTELQNELGGAALLEVTMRVHFARLTNHNRGFFGRMSNTAKVSAAVAPSITMARLSVGQNGAAVGFELQRPLTLDASALSEMRKASKTSGETAAAIGLGLLRAAIGAGSSSSDSFEAVADPARWPEVIGQGMGLTGQMLVQRLTAVR